MTKLRLILLALVLATLSFQALRPEEARAAATTWDLRLMGIQENPPVQGPVWGPAQLTFDDATRTLTYTINVFGVAPELVTSAHIHLNGPVGGNAAAKYDLLGKGETNASGRITLDAADVPGLLRGDHYINVNTVHNPDGAARAQVEPPIRTIYRMEVNARNRGDAAAATSLFADDAEQLGGSRCDRWTPCLTKDGIRRDVELQALQNLRLTTIDVQVSGSALTAREEVSDDAILAAGVNRIVVIDTETYRGDTIIRKVVSYDEDDAQTAAFLRFQAAHDAVQQSDGTSREQTGRPLLRFNDEFDRSGLGPEWTWESPGRTSVYAVSGNLFNLAVTPNNDQWVDFNHAPRILKQPPAAPWTIETKLAGSSGNAATFAGLTVYKDVANWVSFGWLQESSLEFSGIIEGAFTGRIGVSAWYDHLRIRRAGDKYYADASRDGRNWTNVNVFDDTSRALTGARVGVMGKNWDAIGPYILSIEYFRQYEQNLMPALLERVQETRMVAQATGRDSLSQTEIVNICGTDLGVMFDWQDLTYLAFGDTMDCRPSDRLSPNALAFSSDTVPIDGLSLDGWIVNRYGEARSIVEPDPGGLTAIPTAAVAVGENAYIFYMNVTDWQPWTCDRSRIIAAHASDHGAWTKQSAIWEPGNFNQLAILRDAEPGSTTLYLFGTPCGRAGSVKLMKVDEASIVSKDAYRYFAGFDPEGVPVWSADEESAVTVAGGPAGEMSAVYNPFLGRYILTYLDETKAGIVMREAAAPWGPWSPPVVIARSDVYPQLYGAFMKAGMERDDGRTFYYMMSLFGPYNTFWMETTLPALQCCGARRPPE